MLLKMWRRRVPPANFALNYHSPGEFTLCILQKKDRVSLWFLTYRLIMALYFTFTIFVSTFDYDAEGYMKHFIYLTNWSYFVETITFITAFVLIVLRFLNERKNPSLYASQSTISYSDAKSKDLIGRASEQKNDQNCVHKSGPKVPDSIAINVGESNRPRQKMTHGLRFFWLVYTIALPTAVGITIIFWSALYDPERFPSLLKNIILHSTNGLFILIDFLLIVHPVKVFHFYIPMTFGCLYSIFSVIYQCSGGTGRKGLIPIYTILDWREPKKAFMTSVMCVVFVTTLHFIFSALHQLKFFCTKRRRTSSVIKY